jgi:hypothetical protein
VTSELDVDTDEARKARGAFFTPDAVCDFAVNWAIQTSTDSVLEPSCGEAAFMLAASRRLRVLGNRAATIHGPHFDTSLMARPTSTPTTTERAPVTCGCLCITMEWMTTDERAQAECDTSHIHLWSSGDCTHLWCRRWLGAS